MTAVRLALKGDLRKAMNRQLLRAEKAVTRGMGEGTRSLQAELRAQTRHARLGFGVEKAWRAIHYPGKGKASLSAAGLIYSKAPRIHAAFTRGGVIRGKGGWMVIPLPEAVKRGFHKGWKHSKGSKPRKWSEVEAAIGKYGALRYVRVGPGKALLVADNLTAGLNRSKTRRDKRSGAEYSPISGRRASAALFLLVKQVRMKRKIDVARAKRTGARRAAEGIGKHFRAARG